MASTLEERLLSCRGKDSSSSEEECSSFRRWAAIYEETGGQDIFIKRLSMSGISSCQASAALEWNEWDCSLPLHRWIVALEEILLCTMDAAVEEWEMLKKSQNRETLPIAQEYGYMMLIPFVKNARELLKKEASGYIGLLSQNAWADILCGLLNRLYSLSKETLQAKAFEQSPLSGLFGQTYRPSPSQISKETWHKATLDMLNGAWENHLCDYPVLARRLTGCIFQWVDSIKRLLFNLSDNEREMVLQFNDKRPLGKIACIKPDAGDLHHGGQSTAIIRMESGVSLVYKPHDLKNDIAWSRFVDFLRNLGLKYDGVSPKIITGEDYGIMEYIPSDEVKDEKSYFFQAGILLAMVNALGGNDFHAENIISHKNSPVLIDLETIMCAQVTILYEYGFGEAQKKVIRENSDSVMGSGMMPVWVNNANGIPIDIGGFTTQHKSLNAPLKKDGSNLNIFLNRDSFLEGFVHASELLASNRQEILCMLRKSGFEDCRFRYLPRSTNAYYTILNQTRTIKALRDGFEWSMVFERMLRGYLNWTGDSKIEEICKIYRMEYDALKEDNIPVFHVYNTDMIGENEQLVQRYAEKAPVERARRNIEQIDSQVIEAQAKQIELLLKIHGKNCNLERTEEKHWLGSGAFISKEECLEQVEYIFRTLTGNLVMTPDGDISYRVLGTQMETQKLILSQIKDFYYEGLLGIALFFAAIYFVMGKKSAKRDCMNILDFEIRKMNHPGYVFAFAKLKLGMGTGIGGMIFVLCECARLLDENQYRVEALKLIKRITRDQIEKDRHLDYISGCAGLMTAIKSSSYLLCRPETLELLDSCTLKLLREVKATGKDSAGWVTVEKSPPLTGFGHGNAGIILAMMNARIEQAQCQKVMEQALNYEKSLYSHKYHNWADLRSMAMARGELKYGSGWCTGAPGIGLARFPLLNSGVGGISNDVENAIAFALDAPFQESDHVCCGNMSRVLLLVEAYRKMKDRRLYDKSMEIVSDLVARKRSKGSFSFVTGVLEDSLQPSFFSGISGLGYSILYSLEEGLSNPFYSLER